MKGIHHTNINRVVFSNILKACSKSLKTPDGKSYVTNKKGNNFLRVEKVKDKDGNIRFLVTDKNYTNMAGQIAQSIIVEKRLGKNKFHLDCNDFILDRIAFDFEINR